MKNKSLSGLKRAISSVLALSMTVNLAPNMLVSAEIEAGASKTYYGDGYNVKYDVADVWNDHSNVNVTLTNTSDEPIKNWALKYDTDGDIINIWNGVILGYDEKLSIIKNAGDNYEVAPHESVSFGYTIIGADELPESIVLSSQRKDYETADYIVTLNVDSDWDTGFAGNITIEAVGDKPIEAWRLLFDTNFDLTSTWNAKITEANGNAYVIDNTYETAFIQPGEAASFGICGTKDSGTVPEISNISLSGIVVDGEADQQNTPDESIDEKSSSQGETSSEAKESSDSESSIISESSYIESSSKAESSSVAEDSSKSDNSSKTEDTSKPDSSSKIEDTSKLDSSSKTEETGKPESSSKPENSSKAEETSEADSSSKPDDTSSKPEEQIAASNDMWIVAYGSYNEEEKAIDIEWYSSEEADYEVLFSDDNNDYTSLIRENKYTFYHYCIDKDFDIRYFRVDLISDGKYVESIPFVVKRTASGYITEPLDSDEDGLSDITELKIGTDINKPDTDDDGLSDLQEFTITFTDPLDPNSVHPNFTDAEADCDGDGLSNADEIMHGTNPVIADTDDDHLSDGDEINLYGTDPLDPDTDDDDICDGDEIALGYDPKTANADIKTKTVEQHLDKDSKVFAEINTDENAFDISMDITAAGYAPRTLIAKVSPYENAVANDAIVGVVPEFIYPNDLSMSEITLNFEVKDEFIANTNGKYAAVSSDFEGIKRFSVFKYFEEYGLLLPIETTYDTENDTVKTTVDDVGTYCLVDVEKWFESLEIDPAKFESVVLTPSVVGMTGIPFNKTILSVGSDDIISDDKLSDKNIDIVFNIFVNKSSPQHVYDQARLFGETIFDNCDDSCSVHIYVVNYKGDVIPSGNPTHDYITSKEEWDLFFDSVTITKDGRTYSPEIDTTIAAFFNNNSLRAYADKYYVAIESELVEHKKLDNAVNRLIQEDVCALVGANGAMDQHRSLAEITGGQFYNKLNLYGVPMAEYIIDFTRKKSDGQVYKTITSTGLKVITLDAPITSDYLAALRNNDDLSKYADQDEDGLRDLEELRYFIGSKQMITWDNQGKVVLPTFEECLDLVAAEPYIEHAFSQYKGWDMSFMNDWRVLPVKSDPTDADTDKDYAPDGMEKERSTDPLSTDTDGDGLSDGREIVLIFDPTSANSDDDDYNDLDEYLYGLDPFSYDDNYIDLGAQFIDGFIWGDFIEDKSIANIVGQITASLLPYTGKISDIRDFFAAVFSGDAKSIATSLFALIPGHGDLVKGGKELSKFISKHADDFPKVAKTIEKITIKFPIVAKYIDPKAIDTAADGLKGCTKLTKRNYVQLQKTFKAADKALEVHKDFDRLLKNSQKILDYSGKAEEFFDAREKDKESDGGGGDGDDGDGGDDDDEDPLTKAIQASKRYNPKEQNNPKYYTTGLINAFYAYRDKLADDYSKARIADKPFDKATERAVNLVNNTSAESDELIDVLNKYSKQLSVLELYDTCSTKFSKIVIKYDDKIVDHICNSSVAVAEVELIAKYDVEVADLDYLDKFDISYTKNNNVEEAYCYTNEFFERLNVYQNTAQYNYTLSETIKSQHKDINRNNAAKVLEKSLKEAGISFHDNDFKGWTAHHIVAYEASAADYSRKVLYALDIDLNSAANGVFLPNDLLKEDVISESKHNGGHTLDYFIYVNDKLKDSLLSYDSAFDSDDDIENTFKSLDLDELNEVRGIICNTLLDIKVELLNGDLKIHRT